MKTLLLFLNALLLCPLYSQQTPPQDSTQKQQPLFRLIPEINLISNLKQKDFLSLPDLVGTDIFVGKKNTLLITDNVQANNLNNVIRQVFAKVPGIHIWENDPSGIQIGVATRGLSPNRSAEFNIRQNGYEIAADPLSYSEAYYNPQLQGVQKIQILKGAAALQYGTQFGGMINYIMKNGSNIHSLLEIETQQSIGSFQLYNNFNAIGGTINNFKYYAFVDFRNAQTWRQNNTYDIKNYFVNLQYSPFKNTTISLDFTHQKTLSQQPGGLTDSLFALNPQQSLRSRNWFSLAWTIFALNIDYTYTKNALLSAKIFYLEGARKSIAYQAGDMSIPDTINPLLQNYNYRNIENQSFQNFGIEIKNRIIIPQNALLTRTIFSLGIKTFSASSPLQTSSQGSSNLSPDFAILQNTLQNNYTRNTTNFAAFTEIALYFTNQFSITPGCRYEFVQTHVSGTQNYTSAIIPANPIRHIPLLGITLSYKPSLNTEIYTNFTQAYKPFWYGNISTLSQNKLDTNLKDAKGYTIDLGFRTNKFDWLFFDASLFYIKYNNRIGSLLQANQTSFITNVGSSTHYGIEAFAEIQPLKNILPSSLWSFSFYTNYTFTHAYYDNFLLPNGKNIQGNSLPDAPQHILRSGASLSFQQTLLSYQFSYVSQSFSDPNNSLTPSKNATTGPIPQYFLNDLTLSSKFIIHPLTCTIKIGINNLFNTTYFTRRATGLPGSGILPGDTRTFFITLALKYKTKN